MATENKLKTGGGPAVNGVAAAAAAATLLRVDGLTVAYGDQTVVRDVSFELARGQSLALIGESGSGKTTIARTGLRLLPPGAPVPAAARARARLRPAGPEQCAEPGPHDRLAGAGGGRAAAGRRWRRAPPTR